MLILAVFAILQGASPAVTSLDPRPIHQLVHTRWGAKEGAPLEAFALAQTTDGYLWLGTSSGPVRFDGVRFVPLTIPGMDIRSRGPIRNMLGTRDGSLWIVWTDGVVSQFREGHLATYGAKQGLPLTYSLTESDSGVLIAATQEGLAQFAGTGWKDAGRDWGFPGKGASVVWFDRENTLWVMAQDRIVYLPHDGTRFQDPEMPLRRGMEIGSFAQAKDGSVWVAELDRSVHTVPREGEASSISEVMVGSWTTIVDRKGSLWIGTAGDGLRRVIDPARIRGRKVAQFGPEAEQFTQKNGLLSDVITAILEDREGNVWVATPRGLERFREGQLTPFHAFSSVRPRSLFAARDTSLWVITYSATGLLRLRPRGPDTVLTTVTPLSVTQDRHGTLWTVDGKDLLRLQGNRLEPVPMTRGAAVKLTDLTVDPAGTLWVYDEGMGLLRVERDSLIPVVPLSDSGYTRASLFSDRRGRIWIAEQNAVKLYDHGQLHRFDRSLSVRFRRVQGFFEDRHGAVWLAGFGGLSRYDEGRFWSPHPGQFTAGQPAFGVAEDAGGAWWVVTRTGILRLPPGEMDRAIADSSYVVQYRTFDGLDGLPGMINSMYFGSLIARTADGGIWVATDSGVARVDPQVPPAAAAPVLIEALRVDGQELPSTEASVIPPGDHQLEIDYTAVTLVMPERVQFRYRLEGDDKAWHEAGGRRRAYYSGLGPGTYRFEVASSNGDGHWGGATARVEFRVLPTWYQTIWFKALGVVLIGGLGAAVAALIQQQRSRAVARQFEATLSERSRIAQELHDTLLQGMAGVSLQLKVAERALPDRPDLVAETLTHVQQLTRDTMREARERVLDLHEPDLGSDDVASALEQSGRGLVSGSGVAFGLTSRGARRRLPRPLEIAVLRIGREAIANAVKHGGASRIDCVVHFALARLRLEIRDDGRGFTPEQGEQARQQGHLGLSGMQNRAAQVGGTCDVQSAQGGGTVVTVTLPIA